MGFNTKSGLQKYKKARYAIGNVREKDLSKIIKDFEKIDKLPYEKKRPKHEPTNSYFHITRQLAKCMMRYDNLNWRDNCWEKTGGLQAREPTTSAPQKQITTSSRTPP